MKWKRMVSTLLTLALVLGMIGPMIQPAAAAGSWDEKADGWLYSYNSGAKRLSVQYEGDDRETVSELIFPTSYRGIFVRAASVSNFPNLVSVTLPDHVDYLHNYGISNLPKLKTLELPAKLAILSGTNTITKCQSLETIYFPPTFKHLTATNMFSGCNSLHDLYFYGDCPGNGTADHNISGFLTHLPEDGRVHYIEGTKGWENYADDPRVVPFVPEGKLAMYGIDTYVVKVVDGRSGKPIEGASIILRSGSSEASITDTNGLVSLTGPITYVKVSKEGYIDSYLSGSECTELNSDIVNPIYLYQGSVDNPPKRVWAEANGSLADKVDVLTQNYSVIYKPGTDNRVLTLTAVPENPEKIAFCRLRYEAGSASSHYWEFEEISGVNAGMYSVRIPVPDLPAGGQYYLDLRYDTGITSKFPLRLNVKRIELPEIDLGGNTSGPDTTVSNQTPDGGTTLPFSGMEIGLLKWGKLSSKGGYDPQTGNFKIVISSDVIDVEDDKIDEVYDQIKSTLTSKGHGQVVGGSSSEAKKLEEIQKLYSIELANGIKTDIDVLDNSKNFAFKTTIGGILEGNLRTDGILKGTILVALEAKGSHWFQGATPTPVPVPVYGYIEATGNLTMQGNIEWHFSEVKKLNIFASALLELALKGGAGIGVEAVHAGLYGNAKLKSGIFLNYLNQPSRTGITGVAGQLSLVAEVQAFIFKHEFTLLEGSWQLLPKLMEITSEDYENYPNIANSPDSQALDEDTGILRAAWDRMADKDLYTPISRDYLANQSEWLGGEAGIMPLSGEERTAAAVLNLQTSIFSDPQPQLVNLGEGALLVYVGDAGVSRSDNNRTALYYSWFDGSSWSSPTRVDSDDTADFAPNLYSDGTNAWLVWQNAAQSLDNLDLTQMGQALDLSAAKFSLESGTIKVELLGTVTQSGNNVYESMPQITAVEEVPTAAWVENSANDPFGMTGTNTVKTATLTGGTWTETTAAEDLGAVLSLALGGLNGQVSTAWLTDADRSLGTRNDRTLTVWNGTQTSDLSANKGAQGPAYAKLSDNNVLTWVEDGKFMQYDGSDSSQFGVGQLALAAAPETIAAADGKIALLSSMTWDDSASLGLRIYDPVNQTWSQCETLTEPVENQYNRVPTAVYVGGKLIAVFERDTVTNMTVNADPANPDEDAFRLEKTADLCWLQTEAQARLRLDGLIWDDLELDPSGDVNMIAYISNSGTAPAVNPGIAITTPNGGSISVSTQGVIIPGGASARVPFKFAWGDGDQAGVGDYTFTVDGASTSIKMALGLADLAVSAQSSYIGGTSNVAISVKNLGQFPSKGTLVVKDAADNHVIALHQFEEAISYNQPAKFLFTLDDSMFEGGKEFAEIVVSVLADEEQIRTDNDTITVLAEGPLVEREPVPDVLHVSVSGGQDTVLVPADGGEAIRSAAFTASVLNQNGELVEDHAPILWSITELEGVSIDENGVVTVTNSAKATVKDTTGVKLTVTAKCGDMEDTAEITVKRDEQTPTDLKLRRGNLELSGTDSLAAPKAEGANEYQYTAVLLDQYGIEIVGQAVQWTFATENEFVTHQEGKVTVSHGAVQNSSYTITAEIGGKSASAAITVQAECEEHTYVVKSVVPPTCTEQGYTVYQCSVCGVDKTDDYTEAAGHTYGEWTVTQAATANSDGKRERLCSVCGAKDEETISATGGDDKPSGSGSGSSGGGYDGGNSSSSTQYVVSAGKTANGTVTVTPSSAAPGTTVTVLAKPDTGYEVKSLTVTDQNGNKITVTNTSNSKYTFIMPKSKVDVKVGFVRRQTTPSFTDIQSGAYYYDAVAWAVEQGITVGTSATTFNPNAPCTRAQIVTFLWRAAGSPKATSNNPFTDVPVDSYYYDAVLWAVEQGITNGTSATTFSPDFTCLRGQAVTFLYRAAGSPAVRGNNPFKDVTSDTYYTDAVQWAVNKGVTKGTSAMAFSPDGHCIRAQIVTFLYRDRAN